jgi:hypothetical protein
MVSIFFSHVVVNPSVYSLHALHVFSGLVVHSVFLISSPTGGCCWPQQLVCLLLSGSHTILLPVLVTAAQLYGFHDLGDHM